MRREEFRRSSALLSLLSREREWRDLCPRLAPKSDQTRPDQTGLIREVSAKDGSSPPLGLAWVSPEGREGDIPTPRTECLQEVCDLDPHD
jgi:hypothetical protein